MDSWLGRLPLGAIAAYSPPKPAVGAPAVSSTPEWLPCSLPTATGVSRSAPFNNWKPKGEVKLNRAGWRG